MEPATLKRPFSLVEPNSPPRFISMARTEKITARARLIFDGNTQATRMPGPPLKRQRTDGPKIQIMLADYEKEDSHSIATIPGVGSFNVRRLGAGEYHTCYQFEPGQWVTIPKDNDYLFFAALGSYDLSKLVLKVVNPLLDPKAKARQIESEKQELTKIGNPDYRTQIVLYTQDGATLEQKVLPLDQIGELFERALVFAKELLEINVKARETVVFDIKPRNVGFANEGKPLLLDRDVSEGMDFEMDLASDIKAWMNYQNEDAAVKKERFNFLTSNFPQELRDQCWEDLQSRQ